LISLTLDEYEDGRLNFKPNQNLLKNVMKNLNYKMLIFYFLIYFKVIIKRYLMYQMIELNLTKTKKNIQNQINILEGGK